MSGKITNHIREFLGGKIWSFFSQNLRQLKCMWLYEVIIVSRLSRKDRGTLTVPVSGNHVKCVTEAIPYISLAKDSPCGVSSNHPPTGTQWPPPF